MAKLSAEDIEFRENLKKRMRQLLDNSNLAQSSYADKANIDRQHINRWINPNSNRGISIYSVKKFCDVLNISLKFFFDSPLFQDEK